MGFARIVEDVREYFAERGLTAVVDVGWKARAETNNQGEGSANRVVFTPVSPISPLPAVSHPGSGPEQPARQLLNILFTYEVSCWGFDPDDGGENDLFHIGKCIDLLEAVVQAVWRKHHGQVTWGAMRWTDTVKHVRHGAELVATLQLNVPLFDAADMYHPASPVPVKAPLGMPTPTEETDEP